jgi:hypothetical protein
MQTHSSEHSHGLGWSIRSSGLGERPVQIQLQKGGERPVQVLNPKTKVVNLRFQAPNKQRYLRAGLLEHLHKTPP